MAEAIEHRAADGTRLWAALDGPVDAPAVVFLHSIGCDHRLWRLQAEPLSRDRRVICPDARGHGRSDAPAGGYDLDRLGEDVLHLLDALRLPQADVCGLSLGGLTAQWLALRAPGRVRRLVLANTAPRIGTAEAWRIRAETVRTGGLAAIADLAMERFFSPSFRDTEPPVVDETRRTLLSTSAEGYLGCCAALEGADLTLETGAIQLPTLVIAGRSDASTPPEQLRRLAQSIPGASYLELEAGHLSNLEQPDEFTAALRRHLEAA